MICDRCKRETGMYRMSWFNTENICPACQEKEEAHPLFGYAKRAEIEEVARGNFNYPGIGLPDDLKER